jgi:hypothetical protein
MRLESLVKLELRGKKEKRKKTHMRVCVMRKGERIVREKWDAPGQAGMTPSFSATIFKMGLGATPYVITTAIL